MLGSAHHVISVTVKGNTKIILNAILSVSRKQDWSKVSRIKYSRNDDGKNIAE